MVALPGVIRDEEYRRQWIRRMLQIYFEKFPVEAEQLIEDVKEKRRNLQRPDAMSHDGTMVELAEIPTYFYWRMVDVFGQEWRNDPVTRRVFLQEAAAFRINTTSMPQKVLSKGENYAD